MVEQLFELQVIGLDNFCRVYFMVAWYSLESNVVLKLHRLCS